MKISKKIVEVLAPSTFHETIKNVKIETYLVKFIGLLNQHIKIPFFEIIIPNPGKEESKKEWKNARKTD